MEDQENKPRRAIICPLCRQGMRLDAFTITEHDEDQTWSAEPCVICPHEKCSVHFTIRHSRAYFCACKPAPADDRKRKRK